MNRPQLTKKNVKSPQSCNQPKNIKVQRTQMIHSDKFCPGAVRLFNSLSLILLEQNREERWQKETFLCLLFKSIKNMKILRLRMYVAFFLMMTVAPFKSSRTYAYRFFNIIIKAWVDSTQLNSTFVGGILQFQIIHRIFHTKIYIFCFD
jgi:hypothetical protein